MALNPHWLFDAIVPPVSAAVVKAIPDPATMAQLLRGRRYAALGELSGIIGHEGALTKPRTIYKGLKRPFHSVGVDNFVFVYVFRPSCTYRFTASHRPADRLEPPKNSVFVTFVSLTRALVTDVHRTLGLEAGAFRGVILGWEWTRESPGDPGLPFGHKERYARCQWKGPNSP